MEEECTIMIGFDALSEWLMENDYGIDASDFDEFATLSDYEDAGFSLGEILENFVGYSVQELVKKDPDFARWYSQGADPDKLIIHSTT